MAINRVTDMWAWLRGQNPRAEDNQGISSGEMLAVLPDEILVNEIILRVVTQEEGGIILCRLACVCKTFNDLKNDPKILQMAKLSCTNSLSNSKRSYRDFIWRCASMGNLYAIAAVGFNYGFTVGGKESPFFIPERMAASYLLAMSLYESESTRKESTDH
ncbi:OLC1v1019666C1 [Oldenlandia corymbosa var. corymbosa]|uniref:OLC1v1019666C1 n=1 Tax=Oldenlandia corymbosa var. corymbosa TaxID=529605 RepID=A0AAV1EF08_OLDCO|nr:OLC1v1019666C1 [Oldenlandia corymbosa var. corymbosa]